MAIDLGVEVWEFLLLLFFSCCYLWKFKAKMVKCITHEQQCPRKPTDVLTDYERSACDGPPCVTFSKNLECNLFLLGIT